MWVKTDHSTLGQDGVFGNGAMINWDWKDASGNWLHDHSTNDPYYDQVGISSIGTPQQQILPFNSGWTQLVLDCIVPAQVYNDGYPSYGSQFEVPKQIALSPSVSWYNPALGGQIDDGPAWYSDAELYIIPSGSPTPTPTATPTPTPTPTITPTPTPTPNPIRTGPLPTLPLPSPSLPSGLNTETTNNFNTIITEGTSLQFVVNTQTNITLQSSLNTLNATNCNLRWNQIYGEYDFNNLESMTLYVTYSNIVPTFDGTGFLSGATLSVPVGEHILYWSLPTPIVLHPEGWTQFLIGVLGLIMMAASFIVTRHYWNEDEYAKAIAAWLALFFIGLGLFTVMITG